MSDSHRRLSPYVRDEDTLQRGIEQTALAQTRAAMSSVAATQGLTPAEIEGMIAAVKGSRPTHNPYLMREHLRFEAELWNSGNIRVWEMVDEAYQRGLEAGYQLAQAHADQQARLAALVGLLGQEIEWTFKDAEHAARNLEPKPMKVLEGMWATRRAYDAVKACADELEALLGGKE